MNLFNTFLAISADFEKMPYDEKMMLGLVVTGIGILMVFVILGLIILSIYFMNFMLDKVAPKIKLPKISFKKKADAKVEEVKEEVVVSQVKPVYEVDDKRVVACITAAVMQMLDEESDGRRPNISFRINSIKKCK